MSQSRRLRNELLQHIMDEGQATVPTLMALTGYPRPAVVNGLVLLRETGACQRTKTRNAAGYSESWFGLTRSGIDAALALGAAPSQAVPHD